MSDLVERLMRANQGLFYTEPRYANSCKEAAEEIGKLRHDIERHIKIAINLATENEALRCQLVCARAYVDKSIASFDKDPADNDFQRGFLAAMEIVRDEAFAQIDEIRGEQK